jgi:hypothetical protein
MRFPFIAYGTPRKLPRASELPGRVVVLDVAFASAAGGASFDKTTLPFLEGLGARLAMWIDHHDHERHVDYAHDERFVLRTKAEHGACPELVTAERVKQAGHVDTICCHVDFDGICSAAKWVREGDEPYEGADADARAIDTRLGKPTERTARRTSGSSSSCARPRARSSEWRTKPRSSPPATRSAATSRSVTRAYVTTSTTRPRCS